MLYRFVQYGRIRYGSAILVESKYSSERNDDSPAISGDRKRWTSCAVASAEIAGVVQDE